MSPDRPVSASKIIEEFGGLADRFDREALEVLITEVLRLNPRLGLVSKKTPDKVILRLLKLSVELRDFVFDKGSVLLREERPKIVDIGSGGGFPGIVWRLLDESIEMTLIERKQRKALFLERLTYLLGKEKLTVLNRDARDAAGMDAYREKFDLAVTVAVAHPREIGGTVERLVRPSGFFCTVMAGKEKVYPGEIGENLYIERASVLEGSAFLLYKKKDPNGS